METTTNKQAAIQLSTRAPMTEVEAAEYIQSLVLKGDCTQEDVQHIPVALKLAPTFLEVGDMSEQVLKKMIRTYHGGNALYFQEIMKEKFTSLRDELGYRTSPPLEQLLIQQVAICWLQMYEIHLHYLSMVSADISKSEGEYLEKRLTLSQKRFLAAATALAKVRRLTRPQALQVNIGAQQVNAIVP